MHQKINNKENMMVNNDCIAFEDLLNMPDPEPCRNWLHTLDYCDYYFGTNEGRCENAMRRIYKVTYKADGTCEWYDNYQDACDREKIEGTYDELVDYITSRIQKYHPLITRELVASYAYLDKWQFMCFDNACNEYCSRPEFEAEYMRYCEKYGVDPSK